MHLWSRGVSSALDQKFKFDARQNTPTIHSISLLRRPSLMITKKLVTESCSSIKGSKDGEGGEEGKAEKHREKDLEKAKAKRGGIWFQGRTSNSLILVASLLMVSELGLSTFVLFGVVSVGVVKNDWLLVIQLDEKIGYILDLVDVASDIIVSERRRECDDVRVLGHEDLNDCSIPIDFSVDVDHVVYVVAVVACLFIRFVIATQEYPRDLCVVLSLKHQGELFLNFIKTEAMFCFINKLLQILP